MEAVQLTEEMVDGRASLPMGFFADAAGEGILTYLDKPEDTFFQCEVVRVGVWMITTDSGKRFTVTPEVFEQMYEIASEARSTGGLT